MSGRKHADLWRELVDEAGEDAIDRAATVSVAQAEAELKAAGFDVAAERAKAGAFVEALGSGVSSSASRETAPRAAEATPGEALRPPGQGVATVVPIRRRWPIAWLIAATFLGAFGIWVLASRPEPPTSPPTPKQEAEGERERAEESCGEKDWTACKHYLDEAATLDPGGESEARVQRMRQELAVVIAREAGAP